MIRLLHSGARAVAASLALVAVVCLVLQGALAGVAGHTPVHGDHAHHGHHHHHAHSADSKNADTKALQALSLAAGVAAPADEAGQTQRPDKAPGADLDGTCCGSTTCAAVMLTEIKSLHCHPLVERLAVGNPSDPMLGVVPDGLHRPPRSPALA